MSKEEIIEKCKIKKKPLELLHTIAFNIELMGITCFGDEFREIEKVLQRLDEYEQILGNGRLTDRNYKNTTLALDSCKPYLRLGQLEDIYEESKRC